MNDNSKNAREIFLAAVKLAPDQWGSYLDRVCDADHELRLRVAELLRAHQEIGSFLDQPAVGPAAVGKAPAQTAAFLDEAEGPGSVIGPYKLLQQIGEGGMGTVFMAEQTHPVRRRVALKVIKPGMDTAQVIARFEAERQALALMDHPHIAKVLDVGTVGQAFQPDAGGASQAGKPDLRSRPYFVMELVKGISITKYCDDNHLTPGERLELFIPVCQAVQHAHQKGIIHRDLKPSNVLVALYDGRPVPKVIDFGVAKATSQKLTERTMFTQYGQIVGTLEYMSPEQAELNQLDIDTRSDIYSLGVLLYELLTGTTPFARKRLREAAFDEMLRIIREEEPPKPSTRLSTTEELPAIAANRKTEPRKLSDLVRGELDWIVMKALEKDRARRYETANGMAMDIQRYLADEPVLAGAPSAAYRFRRFARRNRAALSTAAVVLAALVVGTCVSVWQAVRATSAEELAQTRLQAETAARNAAVASQQAAEKARRDEAAQRAVAEERFQLAKDAVDKYLKDVADDEDLKRADFNTLRRRLLQSAVPFYQKFVEQKSGDPALEDARGAAYYRLAYLRMELGESEAALADYEQSRAIYEKLAAGSPKLQSYREDLASIHNNLGSLLANLGKAEEAEAAYRMGLMIREKLAADFPTRQECRRDLASSHNNLGTFLAHLGKSGEAEAEFRASVSILEDLAADFPQVPVYRKELASGHNNLGALLKEIGKPREAEAALHAALTIQEELAAKFPTVSEYRSTLAAIYNNLAMVLKATGKLDEAVAACRKAMPLEEKLAADFPTVPIFRRNLASDHYNLGVLLEKFGKLRDAEESFYAALTMREKLAADFPAIPEYREHLAASHNSLAGLLANAGKLGEAEAKVRAGLTIQEKLVQDFPTVPRYRQDFAASHFSLGFLLANLQKWVEAEAAYRAALVIQERLVADFPRSTAYRKDFALSHNYLGSLLIAIGKRVEAEAEFRAALMIQEKLVADYPLVPDYQNDLAGTLLNLAALHFKRQDFAAAVQLLEQALPSHKAALAANPENPTYRHYYRNNLLVLTESRLELGDHARASDTADEMAKFAYEPANDAYNAACFLCRCATLGEMDAKLGDDRRKELTNTYVERALALLRQAVERGFKEAAHMKQDSDLEVLRTREEFKQLIAEIEGTQ